MNGVQVQLLPLAVGLGAAVALAPVAAGADRDLLFAALLGTGFVSAVYLRPPVGAYAYLLLTPLVAGFERGALVPLLRPHEALLLLVALGVGLRSTTLGGVRRWLHSSPSALDLALLLLVLTGSVQPLLWILARGKSPSLDDLLFAATMPKYCLLFAVIRLAVRTQREVDRCLWAAMASAAAVAVVAVLQSLDVLGVPGLLAQYFALEEEALATGRGTATVGSSHAVGDIMLFNLAIALAWMLRGSSHVRILLGAAALFMMGAVASGQYSAWIGLVVCIVAVGWSTGRTMRLVAAAFPATLVGGLLLWPVIAQRLSGFTSVSGRPQSWDARLENLRDLFWSTLLSEWNYLLGVQPAARVRAGDVYIYIESGHTWLLWVGGIPFFVAFLFFSGVALVRTQGVARARGDVVGVAAVGAFSSVLVVFVLMSLDPHLTLRGTADLLFPLLALALVRGSRLQARRQNQRTRARTSAPGQRTLSFKRTWLAPVIAALPVHRFAVLLRRHGLALLVTVNIGGVLGLGLATAAVLGGASRTLLIWGTIVGECAGGLYGGWSAVRRHRGVIRDARQLGDLGVDAPVFPQAPHRLSANRATTLADSTATCLALADYLTSRSPTTQILALVGGGREGDIPKVVGELVDSLVSRVGRLLIVEANLSDEQLARSVRRSRGDRLFEDVRSSADMILVLAPAPTTSGVAKILQGVDGAVLILTSGRTTEADVIRTLHVLKQSGAPVRAVLFTEAETEPA